MTETNEICESITKASLVKARLKIESAFYNFSKHQHFENDDKICWVFEDNKRHLLSILKYIYLLLIGESFDDNCETLITTMTNIEAVQVQSQSLIERNLNLLS